MPLLKAAQGFVDDDWTVLGSEETLPSRGDVVVPWARLTRDWETLLRHDGRLGVLFPNNEKVANLDLYLSRLALVVLNFPVFNDGRSFSIARQLRLDGFSGELRASGNVMPDLLQFMLQVGFDSFEVNERYSRELWIKSLKPMSLTYQHGLGDSRTVHAAAPVWNARHRPPPLISDQKKIG
jgi:uncharacterized protein (DUF934 family)